MPACSDDVSLSRSCKTLVVSWLVARVRATGRVVVFGKNVEPLKVIARGLLARFPDWEMGQEIVHIDGDVSRSVRKERCGRRLDERRKTLHSLVLANSTWKNE